jgi:hypothetical protein
VVEQNASVRQFDGIHAFVLTQSAIVAAASINLLADRVDGHEFPLLLRADRFALRDQHRGVDDPAFGLHGMHDLGLVHDAQRVRPILGEFKGFSVEEPTARGVTGVYGNRTHRELCSNPPLVLKTRANTSCANTPNDGRQT